eukprot:GILI01016243.1.p1 GENE.GILI01016243.1~~GILI01016243.1.p1  ORF type:complete len:104 (-),score=10.59 GILI01016243.1:60-371(-)
MWDHLRFNDFAPEAAPTPFSKFHRAVYSWASQCSKAHAQGVLQAFPDRPRPLNFRLYKQAVRCIDRLRAGLSPPFPFAEKDFWPRFDLSLAPLPAYLSSFPPQ